MGDKSFNFQDSLCNLSCEAFPRAQGLGGLHHHVSELRLASIKQQI